MMHFQPFGDRALLINFEQKIDPAINDRVIRLHQAIEAAQLAGITYCIPAYCSLTVGYEPERTPYDLLCEQIRALAEHKPGDPTKTAARRLRIPVCYEPPFAPDLEDVSAQTGLSAAEIIERHTATAFRVYMLGFLPGFPYLGRLPDQLFCSRKTTPRVRVPARSVALAGYQTGIYPFEAPGGWQIIGRTPLPVYAEDRESPFLFQPGDRVSFQAVTAEIFAQIEKEVAHQTFKLESIYE